MADTTNNGAAGNNTAMPLTPEQLERKYGIRNPLQLAAYNAKLPPKSYLIQDLIPEQGITLSIGASHVGKSPFWGQACIAVAAGLKHFVGRACHSKPGTRVLYLDCENRTRSIQERLQVMSSHLGLQEVPPSLMVGA
jgi:RecA-family ATPase